MTEKDDVSTSGVVINQTLDDHSWTTYVQGLDGAEPWVKGTGGTGATGDLRDMPPHGLSLS
ncbi:MAG: hypothetical protein AAF364_19760 [Pseudomonadota bacterium]